MERLPIRLATFTAAVLGMLAGCATTEERAREVFRYHNRITNDVMLLLPEIEAADPEAAARVWDAEEAMIAACAPLDELAVRHREGETPGVAERARVPGSLEDCEAATRKVEQLLQPWWGEPAG